MNTRSCRPHRHRHQPQLTNPKVNLPRNNNNNNANLIEIPNIITNDEASKLVKALDKQYYRNWCWEGYDRRHRVQRYSSSDDNAADNGDGSGSDDDDDDDDDGISHGCCVNGGSGTSGDNDGCDVDDANDADEDEKRVSMEEAFGWIFNRIISHSSQPDTDEQGNDTNSSSDMMILHRPFEVTVIEHTPSSCRSVVNTFEQNALSSCRSLQQQQQQQTDSTDGEQQQSSPSSTPSSSPQSSSNSNCNCYIAQLTLMNNAIQSIEKPFHRELECWDLAPPIERHETNIIMQQNGVILKRGDVLWDWRGKISDIREKKDCDSGGSTTTTTTTTCNEEDGICNEMDDNLSVTEKKKPKGGWTRIEKLKASNKRCFIVTFRGIRQPEKKPIERILTSLPKEVSPSQQPTTTAVASSSSSSSSSTVLPKRLPLSELLTIIVTTSPVRSNPSAELLEQTFDTFSFGGEEFAYDCPKVIVCDGCRVLENENDDDNDNNNNDTKNNTREEKKDERTSSTTPKITRRYANTKQTLRNGIATVDQAGNYREFKSRLRKLCEEADNENEKKEKKSPFRNTRVVELEERHGYGFALRHALYHCVDTPYVCVIQHDRTFMRPTPIEEVVTAMKNDATQKVKYVGVSMRSNLMYYDIFSGKYGRRAVDEFKTMILYPNDLRIGGNVYGPDGTSVENVIMPRTEKRRKNLEALKDTYRGSHQRITYDEWLDSSPPPPEGNAKNENGQHYQLSLTPTLFWYDNTHIVDTAHYRDYIFNPQYKMVARGGFVEDKLSPCIVRSCERLGLTDGHAKFGCYLLDDHSGVIFTGHLDGGSFMTANVHHDHDRYVAKKMAANGRKNE